MLYEINIGLYIGTDPNHTNNRYAGIRRRYDEVLNLLYRWVATSHYQPSPKNRFLVGEEPTMVAVVDLPNWDRAEMLANRICWEFEQDCVAVRNTLSGEGRLIGPRAADWGEFDRKYFTTWAEARKQ
jgi:hypothetical protein